MDLNEYLDQSGAKRWKYSYVDCQMFAADWAYIRTGIDPATDLRGTYSTAAEANAIVASHNGCVAFVHERLYATGWKWIFSGPRDGDIGVIEVETAFDGVRRKIPAIHQGGLWLSKSIRGIVGGEFKPEAMWTL